MAEGEKNLRRELLVLGVAFVFTILGGVITHALDRNNWVSQHREERQDARRQEAGRVFDTTIVSLSRIGTSTNGVIWGIKQKVTRDSVAQLVSTYSRDVYAFENQAPRLESLIKVYFDLETLGDFVKAVSALEASERETTEIVKSSGGNFISPQKMRELMLAIFKLSDHMAQRLAASDTT